MRVLTKEELWRCYLSKEPTLKERRGRYFREGFRYYRAMCRCYPLCAIAEIGACALILALMFGALYLKEIILWAEGALR